MDEVIPCLIPLVPANISMGYNYVHDTNCICIIKNYRTTSNHSPNLEQKKMAVDKERGTCSFLTRHDVPTPLTPTHPPKLLHLVAYI